jgi:parallel beta-helix repeat protein
VNGTATLGNNTTLSGFAITNATGSAIQGTSIQNVTIRDNRITNPSEQGINLTDVAGTSLIANNTITGSRLGGIFVSASGNTQQELNVNSNTIVIVVARGFSSKRLRTLNRNSPPTATQ